MVQGYFPFSNPWFDKQEILILFLLYVYTIFLLSVSSTESGREMSLAWIKLLKILEISSEKEVLEDRKNRIYFQDFCNFRSKPFWGRRNKYFQGRN